MWYLTNRSYSRVNIIDRDLHNVTTRVCTLGHLWPSDHNYVYLVILFYDLEA